MRKLFLIATVLFICVIVCGLSIYLLLASFAWQAFTSCDPKHIETESYNYTNTPNLEFFSDYFEIKPDNIEKLESIYETVNGCGPGGGFKMYTKFSTKENAVLDIKKIQEVSCKDSYFSEPGSIETKKFWDLQNSKLQKCWKDISFANIGFDGDNYYIFYVNIH